MILRQTQKPVPARAPIRGKRGVYVRRDRAKVRKWRIRGASLLSRNARSILIREQDVLVAGTPAALEDFMDGWEIDRRMADPANQRRLSWQDLKGSRGL